jgi:hypothetical protein
VRFYPDIPGRRMRTLVRDLLVLAALVLFAALGVWVHDLIDNLAVLGEGVRKVGSSIPFAGDPIEHLGERGENDVHHFANMLGLLFFALPAVALLVWYVPRRAQQVSALTAAARVLAGADPRLVAMRAAFSLPYGRLAAYTRDPFGDLAAENYAPLVDAALADVGLLATSSTTAPPRPRGGLSRVADSTGRGSSPGRTGRSGR